MPPLTTDRQTPERLGSDFSLPVLAATLIYAGSIVVLDAAGMSQPGSTAVGLVCAGRADERADNSAGADGDIKAKIRSGVFRFGNSAAADEITAAEIGDDCYIVDDQTLAKTDGTGTRSVAGKVVDVDTQGVWVRMGL